MQRQVWATLKAAAPKANVRERDYAFVFDPISTRPQTLEEYKRRAMAAWAGAGGGLIVN